MTELRNLKVLLIEEHGEDIEIITDVLGAINNASIDLTTILSVSSLENIIQANKFDVILLDPKQNDSSDLTAIETAHSIAYDMPIIILTDIDDEQFSIDAVHHGVQDYLVKSLLDPATLYRSMQYAIERNHLRIKLREEHERSQYLASHDELTDLPNRKLLRDRFEQQLARYARYQQNFAAMFIDLDSFKKINDCYGHVVGDKVLQETAARLEQHLRKTDTIARIGGDEFFILITHLLDIKNIIIVAEKVLGIFEQDFEINGNVFPLYASIGITLIPQDGTDLDTLLHRADQAMYRVKHSGGRGYQLYNPRNVSDT